MHELDMIKMLPELGERINRSKPIAYSTYQRHINRYIFVSKFVQNKVVLDIGCGIGTGTRYWVIKGAKKIIGMDIAEDAIKDAKAWNKKINGADFVLGDAQVLPFLSDSFDVVISLDTIEHLKEPEEFLLECKRVIKKEGIFICSTPNKKVTSPLFKKPGNPYHVKEFYPKEFYGFVSNYFKDAALYGQHMLSLRDRIKPGLITIAGLVLASMPSGNNIKKLLRRIGKPMLMEAHLPEFRENFDEMADEYYQVIPYKRHLFEIPETLIVVAKAGE